MERITATFRIGGHSLYRSPEVNRSKMGNSVSSYERSDHHGIASLDKEVNILNVDFHGYLTNAWYCIVGCLLLRNIVLSWYLEYWEAQLVSS